MRFGRSALELSAATFALTIAAFYSIRTSAALVDPDIWWHISVGDWIAANHTLPRTGILSQHVERPWVAYSWGFDLLVSAVHRISGVPGIISLLVIFQVLVSFVFLLAIRRSARNPWWSCLVAAVSIYAFYINPLRPALFTLLFFTVQLLIIFEAERRDDDRLLFWMGPLFCAWANTHIQFVYGLFVLVLYVAARVVSLATTSSLTTEAGRRAAMRGVGALGVAVACSAIGPNGVLPHRVALEYATQLNQYQVIQELRPIDFRRPEHYAQLLLLMSACFAVGKARRFNLFRAALLVATAAVSFRAMRDSWFVSIAAGFVLADAAGQPARDRHTDDRAVAAIRPAVLYSLAGVLALGVSFALASRHGMTVPELAGVIDRVYPLRATEFVRQSGLEGPMYNDFNWGGFLTSRLPDHPVAIDPRADLYDGALFAQSLRTANAAPGWQKDPDLARANFVIIQRWFPLASALANDAQFRLVYQDHIAAVFVRGKPRQ
jgi:hypothetical protein